MRSDLSHKGRGGAEHTGTRRFQIYKSGTYTFAEPFDRGFNATLAVRDLERLEADFDDTQGAQNHRGVDVSHMGDPECLAAEFADPDPEHHAAFLLAIALQRQRIVAVGHHDGRDRVGALGRDRKSTRLTSSHVKT